MRLKVQLADNQASSGNSYRKPAPAPLKFIYVLNSPLTTTIDDLTHLLEVHLVREFSIKTVRIVQLMTDDGYILPKDHLCSAVLEENERIVCYDMERFVQESYPTLDLENLWCEIKQHDASDNLEKSIQVGLNNLGKLFIRMHGSSNSYGLYMFNVYELLEIARKRTKQKRTIARLGQSDWFVEAKWEYDLVSDTTLFVLCNLKVASSEQMWSNKLRLLLDEAQMSIEKGGVTCLSGQADPGDNLTDYQRARLTVLASQIPLPTRVGPEIDVDRDVDKKTTKHECEGDSLVRMAYGSTNTITAQQDSRASDDGTFRQYIVITHINFYKQSSGSDAQENAASSEKPLSVADVAILYQANDGAWCECEDIAIALIALRDEEPRWLADSVIHVEPDKLLSIVLKGCMRVQGKPGRDNFTRRRIHKNLPQPLKLKIVIKDNFNKQSSLIVEQLNIPLEYDTSDSFLKYNQASIDDLLAFVYADDCEADERLFLAIYVDKERQLVIKSGHSYSLSIDRKNIRTMEYNAKQSNTAELPFDALYHHSDTQEKKAVALFDPQTFMLYAVRLEVSTKTSRTEQTVLLPLEQIK